MRDAAEHLFVIHVQALEHLRQLTHTAALITSLKRREIPIVTELYLMK